MSSGGVLGDLYAAILARAYENEKDDAARLVYADAIEEAGDRARAELIVAQCELAGERWRWIERPGLRDRVAELLSNHQERWNAPLAKLGVIATTYERGFVHGITVRAPAFARHAAEIFRLAPIRTVHLVGLEELRTRELQQVLASPELACVDGLGLPAATLNNKRLEAIFSKDSAATRVASLDLSRTSWDEGALRSLFLLEAAMARRVKLHDMTARFVGERGRRPRPIAAEVLSLFPETRHISMTAPALTTGRFVAELRVRKLQTIEIRATREESRLLASVCARLCSPKLSAVTELRLRGLNELEDLVPSIGNAPFVAQLETLELGDRGFWGDPRSGMRDVNQLIKMLHKMSSLSSLSLCGIDLDASTFEAIVDHPSRGALRVLSLHQCKIDPHGFEALIASPHLHEHTHVELFNVAGVSEDTTSRLRERFKTFEHATSPPAAV